MRTSRRFLGVSAVLFLGCTFLAGCAPDGFSAPRVAAGHRSALELRESMKAPTTDFDHLTIEIGAPGYGGGYIGSDGAVHAWMRDASNGRQLKAALEGLGAHRAPLMREDGSQRSIVVDRGDFLFSELVQWKSAIFANAQPAMGIRLVDADEVQNRVRVGVSSWDREALVRRLAMDLGIPQAALTFTIIPLAMHATRTALDGTANPKLAGMQITYLPGAFQPEVICTEGFTVSRGSTNYFLTAGHCTGVYTGGGSTMFYQPDSATQVGSVYENPAWSTNCPNGGQYCNTVDAAMISFKSGIASQKTVVETSVIGTGQNAGDRWIANIYPVGATHNDWVGHWVYKTGAVTGTTYGPVTAVCVDIGPYGSPSVTLTCQNEAQLQDQFGDSGGPVTYVGPPLQPSVRWASGLAFAALTKPDGHTYAYYSPASSIMSVFSGISFY